MNQEFDSLFHHPSLSLSISFSSKRVENKIVVELSQSFQSIGRKKVRRRFICDIKRRPTSIYSIQFQSLTRPIHSRKERRRQRMSSKDSGSPFKGASSKSTGGSPPKKEINLGQLTKEMCDKAAHHSSSSSDKSYSPSKSPFSSKRARKD